MKQPTLLLGITGGISAYKLTDLASRLTKEGIRVLTVMTDSAQQFITPLTMETLTKQRCYTQLFDRQTPEEVTHIWLAQQADVVLVAPATANFLAKMTYGLADDLLSSVLLATTAPVLVSPAMNVHMYRNPATQQNLAALQQRGVQVIPPEEGLLACGETGEGRLPETETLYRWVKKALAPQDLAGKKILVTAGATREAVDPVRFLTNHSTGKMGYAVAQAAWQRGAEVTLVSGVTALNCPVGVNRIPVTSAADMMEAVQQHWQEQDAFVLSAAVADFTPEHPAGQKIKKEGQSQRTLSLAATQDILAWLGEHKKQGQRLCGFSMETEHLLENSRKKLERKKADMIAANSLTQPGAGFGVDTNCLTLIGPDWEEQLPLMSKEDCAGALLDKLLGDQS
ncbi:MAG TPA: bifunctional phosphopantothenoylcysteine decarboxylase/phosphopantothenate--cysteine ligase CoaBC [Candidatus Egerieicola faecale]|uniref:Coenzyme A biosynthesis bifunctional protein CoaBC n=1 Tax=Candidatus Egerieicola faecale TaxID=2840774 RepID=A0A9D1IUC3_9FIRM|nr:bifunctional phosphopantothenoylcysteine decarboxylase/phosphopantothenate--cysteine ligase CoaBC [Candidatus Egerieicola faecale]